MNVDTAALRRLAPFAAPLLVLAGGWMLLIAPASTANARAGRDLDVLRQRLAQVRASVGAPPPAPDSVDPGAAFERQVAVGDASSQVLEQLAGLASGAHAANLLIETGDRVPLARAGAPQAGGTPQADPRFSLFDTPLTYSPISMSFDAEFASVGQLLWRLRDLATTVELRSLEIKPAASGSGRVHAALTLFAYARPRASAGSPTAAAADSLQIAEGQRTER